MQLVVKNRKLSKIKYFGYSRKLANKKSSLPDFYISKKNTFKKNLNFFLLLKKKILLTDKYKKKFLKKNLPLKLSDTGNFRSLFAYKLLFRKKVVNVKKTTMLRDFTKTIKLQKKFLEKKIIVSRLKFKISQLMVKKNQEQKASLHIKKIKKLSQVLKKYTHNHLLAHSNQCRDPFLVSKIIDSENTKIGCLLADRKENVLGRILKFRINSAASINQNIYIKKKIEILKKLFIIILIL